MDLTMLIPIFGILLVMIPVAGLTFALTLRMAVRPFVETLAKEMKESGHVSGTRELTAQIMVLQEEFETLTHEVRGLRSAQDFGHNLLVERDKHVTPAR